MDYVIGSCSAQFDTTLTPWSVSLSCDITQANSTRGRYRCKVLQRYGTSPETDATGWLSMTPPSALPASSANPAHCNTKLTWPTVDGRYTYRVQLRPGRNNFVNAQFQGDNEIRNPVSPSIGGCGGSDYLAENSRVQCTCTTANTGKPPGRLVWRETGDVGNTSVQMTSSPLLRGNHTFTCLVAWATNNTVSSVTVKVGYKPEALSIKIGSTSDEEVTVSENDPVTLTCQADARPVATLTLTRQGEGQVTSGQSPLSHVMDRARCKDTGQYVCSATNSLGQADNTVTKTLLVACSPRRTETDLGALNFMNQTASLSFDVISFPSPSSTFTFMYTGVSGKDTPGEVKDIELLAKCYVRSEVNQFQCNVIVLNMMSPQAAGFYTVNVTNDRGGQLYTFQLLYNAATTDEQCQCSDCPPSYLSVAVGLAVVLGLVVTANIVVAVWLWRRAWAMPCAGHEVITNKETTSQTEPADDDDITLPSASGVPQESGPYDSLRMSEVGLRSQYSVIHHKHPRSTGSTIYEGTTEYQNQRP